MAGGIVDVLQFAIDGVSTTQDTVANNLANSQTPGFSDSETSFETSLSRALNSNGTATATVTTTPSGTTPGANGNNVSLSDELIEAEKETLQFQTVSESLNAQFRLVRGSAGGSFS